MSTEQQTLSGETSDKGRERPDTFVVCVETEEFILRSRRFDWPHDTVSVEEWFEPEEDDADESPYDEYDADEKVGAYYDITLEYTVSYRFRVPAFSEHEATEVAKDLKLDARPADSYHVHTDKREVSDIERQELPDDWDPYGGERIHEVLEDE